MKKFYIIFIMMFFSPVIYANLHKGAELVKLQNGLTVILKKDSSVPTASVNIWVKAGSVNENNKQAGLSHFIEHLLFKGSKNYPGDLMTRNVEKMGGLINAATSKEYTCYYIDIQKDGYIESIKMLADTVSYPLFPEDELNQERKVVVEEIQRHKDNPQSQLFEYFMQALYKNSAYKNSIIGSSDVIKNISREEIISYFEQHYNPSNMAVSVVGDIDIKETMLTIENTLGKLKDKHAADNPVILEKDGKGTEKIVSDKTAHSYMLYGFTGPDLSSKDIYTADVTMDILGGGQSSRLYRSLKEEKGFVFSISSSFMSLKGSGSVYISSVFDKKNYENVLAALENEISKFINDGPSEEELKKVKTNIKANWLFGLQTFSDQASQLGYWHLQQHPEIFENYLQNIEKVTADDVKKFMKKYYSKDKISKAVIFPK